MERNDVNRAMSDVLAEALHRELKKLPEGTRFYATEKAQDSYLASPETDHWTDHDVERYGVLATIGYHFLRGES